MPALWSYQVHENDAFPVSCVGENRPENCPKVQGSDWGIPFSPIPPAPPSGSHQIIGGTKPGDILALDPDRNGTPESELWRVDTAHPFNTVNKVQAKCGPIMAPGPTVAHGMLFIGSAYSTIAGQPGNVLLAFVAE
jgi:hypothetical protein